MPRIISHLVVAAWLATAACGCGALSANGATEIYEAECAAKDGAKCLYLGARLVKGEGVASDPVRARQLLGEACALGEAHGCLLLAELLEAGSGGPMDQDAATKAYGTACAAKLAAACAKLKKNEPTSDELSPQEQVALCGQGSLPQCLGLGAAWLLAGETDEAAANAAVYLTGACDKGSSRACALACELVVRGKGEEACGKACDQGVEAACLALKRTPPVVEGAAPAPKQEAVCELGDPDVCRFFAQVPVTQETDLALDKACAAKKAVACLELQGRLFARGNASWKKALAKAEQGCRVEAGPCCFAAAALTTKLALGKDTAAKSTKLLDRGCAAGHGQSCRLQARTAAAGDVRTLLGKGCEAGDAPSCVLAGESWQAETHGAKDGLRAMASYAKGCELQDADACLRHGKLLAEHAYDSVSDQIAAYLKACELGVAAGCREAALRSLEGATPDLGAARGHAAAACDKGDAEGCRLSGDLLAEGQGGPKDIAGAKPLFEKACDGGVIVACVQRGKLR